MKSEVYHALALDGVDVALGRVVGAARRVVDKVLGRTLDGRVFGITGHRPDVVAHHMLVVVCEVAEGDLGHTGQLARGIVGAQRCPV